MAGRTEHEVRRFVHDATVPVVVAGDGLTALGAIQVEVAAAALAAWPWLPDGVAEAVLHRLDAELRASARRVIAATCTPGRPSVVRVFTSSSSRPANWPDNTCSFARGTYL